MRCHYGEALSEEFGVDVAPVRRRERRVQRVSKYSLADRVADQPSGRLSRTEIVSLLDHVSTELADLHARDLIHGDVTAANIIRDGDRWALSTPAEHPSGSPESDVQGLGRVAHRCAVGEVGDDSTRRLDADQPVETTAEMEITLDPYLEDLIGRSMSADAGRRPSAREFQLLLDAGRRANITKRIEPGSKADALALPGGTILADDPVPFPSAVIAAGGRPGPASVGDRRERGARQMWMRRSAIVGGLVVLAVAAIAFAFSRGDAADDHAEPLGGSASAPFGGDEASSGGSSGADESGAGSSRLSFGSEAAEGETSTGAAERADSVVPGAGDGNDDGDSSDEGDRRAAPGGADGATAPDDGSADPAGSSSDADDATSGDPDDPAGGDPVGPDPAPAAPGPSGATAGTSPGPVSGGGSPSAPPTTPAPVVAGTAELSAVVSPSSRSVPVGQPATVFANVTNAGDADARSCTVGLRTSTNVTFAFQRIDQATNDPTGTANAPIRIRAGTTETFVLSLTPQAVIESRRLTFDFACSGGVAAPTRVGVNTLQFAATGASGPDIVALAATPTGNQTLNMAVGGAAAFSLSTTNVGTAGAVTATVGTGAATLPLVLSICATNAATGACLSPAAATATRSIGADGSQTYSVFATATGGIASNSSSNRIVVRFTDAGGVERGSVSVAVVAE